jgi:hypothetical protein
MKQQWLNLECSLVLGFVTLQGKRETLILPFVAADPAVTKSSPEEYCAFVFVTEKNHDNFSGDESIGREFTRSEVT